MSLDPKRDTGPFLQELVNQQCRSLELLTAEQINQYTGLPEQIFRLATPAADILYHCCPQAIQYNHFGIYFSTGLMVGVYPDWRIPQHSRSFTYSFNVANSSHVSHEEARDFFERWLEGLEP